jgi:flagellar basal-body rod protein FlgB
MLDKLTARIDFQGSALVLRAERQRQLASNIANVDTPGYVAHDVNFKAAMAAATGEVSSSQARLMLAAPGQGSLPASGTLTSAPTANLQAGASGVTQQASAGRSVSTTSLMAGASSPRGAVTHPMHQAMRTRLGTDPLQNFPIQAQPSADNNTVDIDRERAALVDNTVRYEAALRFINGTARTLNTAITGQ